MKIVVFSMLSIVLILAGCTQALNPFEDAASRSIQKAVQAAMLEAQNNAAPSIGGKLRAKPFVYDPDGTGIIVSAWVPHTGLPDAGVSDHGLVLQKNGATTVNAAAGAVITGATGATLSELGFDYKADGHCGAGSPRFNVMVGGTRYFFGCIYGVHTDLGNGWIRVRFNGSEPGAGGFDGIIESISIVADEGTDITGQGAAGQSVLDNIDVNGTLIGKPGNSD
jgi:hypothetical protein